MSLSRIYFDLDASKFSSTSQLIQFIKANRLCLYSSVSKDKNYCSLSNEILESRIGLNNGAIDISVKQGDENLFHTIPTLNPRTELVLGAKWTQPKYTLNYGKPYTIIYECLLDSYTTGTEILQIMGNPEFKEMDVKGQSKPLFQLEQREDRFTMRGWGLGVNVNGKLTCNDRSPGVPVVLSDTPPTKQWYTFMIHFLPDNKNGILRVWIKKRDDLFTENPQFKEGCNNVYDAVGKSCWIQFGLYMKSSNDTKPRTVKTDQTIHIKKLQIYNGLLAPLSPIITSTNPTVVVNPNPVKPTIVISASNNLTPSILFIAGVLGSMFLISVILLIRFRKQT